MIAFKCNLLGDPVFTRVRLWQRRNSTLITGLLMSYLWTCLGIASASGLVKAALLPIALWKLLDTLNVHFLKAKNVKEEVPHVGGGINSSAAALDKEHAHVG